MSEDTFDKDTDKLPEKEGHSDYKPVDQTDEAVKHQLSGMYQNWFLLPMLYWNVPSLTSMTV